MFHKSFLIFDLSMEVDVFQCLEIDYFQLLLVKDTFRYLHGDLLIVKLRLLEVMIQILDHPGVTIL